MSRPGWEDGSVLFVKLRDRALWELTDPSRVRGQDRDGLVLGMSEKGGPGHG